MTKISGYTDQHEAKIALVNEFKADEERLLRKIDEITGQTYSLPNTNGTVGPVDIRWASIARSHFEQGFMALNRSVFRPMRISLPDDDNSGENV